MIYRYQKAKRYVDHTYHVKREVDTVRYRALGMVLL